MSHKARGEYFRAIYGRYQKGDRKARQAILNEFCLNTGYHRKYAIRLLNGASPGPRGKVGKVRRQRVLSYGPQTLAVLTAVWDAAGYPWSVRLKALLPTWMPWIRQRFKMSRETERKLLAISPRQMDRRLRDKKLQARRRLYGRTQPGLLLKHQIAVKTENWEVCSPGFTAIDLVAHSGNSGAGEFGHTLTVTDIHGGWTGVARHPGAQPTRGFNRYSRGRAGAALRLAGSGLRQRFGIHQLEFAGLVPGPEHSTDPRAALQEGRQRPRRAEELDAGA